jgi:hypothetical protein
VPARTCGRCCSAGDFTKTGPFNLKDGLLGILLVFISLGVWATLASLVMIRRAEAMSEQPHQP